MPCSEKPERKVKIMKKLNRDVGEVNYDGLISDINPPVEVRGRIISKVTAAAMLPRGTVLAVSKNDGRVYPLGSSAPTGDTLTADCVLCDDVTIGMTADVKASVYTAGCFNTNKITVNDDYTITRTDFDELRKRNIVFKAKFEVQEG
jgi:hypothetical protein